MQALGVYREAEFSPGKVAADAAILDAVLGELSASGLETAAMAPEQFCAIEGEGGAELVLAMCQGENALAKLAAFERRGALAINSALAIRNCYRDLLSLGLSRAGVPIPDGGLVSTREPIDPRPLAGVDRSSPMYVKRGDLHALTAEDVQRVVGRSELENALAGFARRGIRTAYVQQEVPGDIAKFYGVSSGEFFVALAHDGGEVTGGVAGAIARAAADAAIALGLEAWGGDAAIDGSNFKIIDFNDWPSYSRVREPAAAAIARRCLKLLRRRR